jgi:hypothetical protein
MVTVRANAIGQFSPYIYREPTPNEHHRHFPICAIQEKRTAEAREHQHPTQTSFITMTNVQSKDRHFLVVHRLSRSLQFRRGFWINQNVVGGECMALDVLEGVIDQSAFQFPNALHVQ